MLFNMTSYVKCKIRWIAVAQHRILPSKSHIFFPGVLHFINQNRIPTLSDNLEKMAFVSANHWLLFKIWRAKWNGKQILRFICAHFHCTSWCIDVFILVHYFFFNTRGFVNLDFHPQDSPPSFYCVSGICRKICFLKPGYLPFKYCFLTSVDIWKKSTLNILNIKWCGKRNIFH